VLFTSPDKEDAEKHAREMREHHELNLKVNGESIDPSSEKDEEIK
jgi:dihydropteroate synthase